jgi:metal-responsive CopG/Arc/MetJ family transcriptional regulator
MGRKARTEGPDSSEKPVQLNAKVPEQLLLAFNRYWAESGDGKRDDLVVDALRFFLKRKPPKRVLRNAAASFAVSATGVAEPTDTLEDTVIEITRRHAQAIVNATDAVRRNRRRTGTK